MARSIPYEEVAEFVHSWPSQTKYALALAEKYGIPVASARRWINEARRRGYLPAGSDPRPCRLCGGTGVQVRGAPARR